MKVAITGDRTWGNPEVRDNPTHDFELIYRALSTLDPEKDEVILGDAHGVDKLAFRACQGLRLAYVVEVADWKRFGGAAGPIRNAAMIGRKPDQLWYFHDDIAKSKGTKNCRQQAWDRGISVLDGRDVK